MAEHENDAQEIPDESAPPVRLAVKSTEAGSAQPAKIGYKRKEIKENLSHLFAEQVAEDDDYSNITNYASPAKALSNAKNKANKTQPLLQTFLPETTPARIQAFSAQVCTIIILAIIILLTVIIQPQSKPKRSRLSREVALLRRDNKKWRNTIERLYISVN